MSALVDELLKQAAILERHAFKTKCWPGDNDFEDAANPMRRAAAELTTLQSRLEAVKAERDAARELLTGEQQALDRTIDSYQSEYRKREAAEARVEELQKALMDIAYMNRSRDQLQDMARAILQKEPSDGNKS
jgi:flagellar biosynthesis GTPase FlhF